MKKIRFVVSFSCVLFLMAVFFFFVRGSTETKQKLCKEQKREEISTKDYAHAPENKFKIDSKRFMIAKELDKYLAKSKTIWSKEDKEDVVEALIYIESKYGYSPLVFLKLIKVESNFKIKAMSPDGAVGLCQIQPQTAKFISLKMGSPTPPREILFDPVINLKMSAYYLNYLESKFNALPKALAAYNMGPQKYLEIYKYGGIPQGVYHKRFSE